MSCYSQSFVCEHQLNSAPHHFDTIVKLHFTYQGAEETEVCGDGAGTRCAGSTDQGHEHTAESASHASGTLAADDVKGASMCKRRPLYLICLRPLSAPCMHKSIVVCRQ